MKNFYLLFVSVFGLDMITKTWVRSALPLGAEISVAPFFSLVHVTNTGVAFGLFQGNNGLLAGVGAVFSGLLVWFAYRSRFKEPFLTTILGLVIAGAWGNLLDRLRFGRVTDFLDFYWGSHHWPAFNVADSAICVGAVLLIWDNFNPIGRDKSIPQFESKNGETR